MENAVQGIEPSANRVPGAVKYDLKTLGLLSQLGRYFHKVQVLKRAKVLVQSI